MKIYKNERARGRRRKWKNVNGGEPIKVSYFLWKTPLRVLTLLSFYCTRKQTHGRKYGWQENYCHVLREIYNNIVYFNS